MTETAVPKQSKPRPKPGTWEELDALELAKLVPEDGSLATEPGEPCAGEPDEPPAPTDGTRGMSGRPGWPPAWRREPPANDLFGLALSGGGIRSATFNLGVLQGLAEKGLLDCFHYLSTVSGGGYVGGFWSAWRAQKDRREEKEGKEKANGETKNAGAGDVFPLAGPGQPEAPEVRHLREFSNFLRPRTSLFEIETARMVSALISGVVPCIVIAFASILFTLGLWWTLAWLFTGEVPGTPRPGGYTPLPWLPMALYAGVTAAILGISERRLWKRSKPKNERSTSKERGGHWAWATTAIILSSLLAGVVWFLAPSPALLLLGVPISDLPTALGNALFPAIPWMIVALILLGVRVTFSRCFRHDWTGRMRQAAADRTMTRLVLAAATWSGLAVAWVGGQLVAEAGVSGVVGALGTGGTTGALFAWLRRTLLTQSNEPAGRSLLVKLGFTLYQALAYLTLIAIAAGAAALIVVVFTRFGSTGLWLLLGIVGVVGVTAFAMDPHEVGLHKFYRARLARAYLGPSNVDAPPRGTAEAEGDDLPLRARRSAADRDVATLPDRPFHLICCAANDLAGDPLGSLGRGAESAVASKLCLQVGDRYRRWECMESGAPWLSDVLTASGAAFNSHMGQISARLGKAVTFLLTALGLRLGLWLENPGNPEAPGEEADGPPVRRRAPGYLFLRELISDSRADAPWIHLSDGAHFENLALYELVRRHCRFILLCDCGADPDRAFDDFGNAVRRVREDFGVEIEIDISPLAADPKTGKARQPMVAGDIIYPASKNGEKGDVGVLLYVKPTLTGTEPPDVAQYAERNAQFPHESTIDQFYDEAQWESYRRLGRHAIAQALKPIESYLPHDEEKPHRTGESCGFAHAFVRARYYWPPQAEDEPNLDRLEKEWIALENRLVSGDAASTPGVEALRRQVSLRRTVGVSTHDEDQLVQVLPLIREAMRLMEQVYLRTGFGRDERAPSNRLYMGWFNRFGLWTSSPFFRAWWPWLAPYHSADFVDFLQGVKEFGLEPTVPRGQKKVLVANDALPKRRLAIHSTQASSSSSDKDCTPGPVKLCHRPEPSNGYARTRFEALAGCRTPHASHSTSTDADEDAEKPRAGEERIYELDIAMAEPDLFLNAGVVRLRVDERPEGENEDPQRIGKVARWCPSELYVPPGLWAIGVGERLVRALIAVLAEEKVTRIEVETPEQPSISEDALYLGAGFRRRAEGGFSMNLKQKTA